MAHLERSAGFVIYHQFAPNRPVEFLLLDYGRHWDFPKGHVEAGENDLATATRELQEETGMTNPRVIPGFHEEMTYFFRHKRHGLVRKTVVFFLAEVATSTVKLSHEHTGYAFLKYQEALTRLTFPTARQILRTAWEKIGATKAADG
ncbi:MAG TPA: NUDIX domain-containing protein [Tepidisphaeraceae bacterium]|jgi:8-oxo-dGTP pyrophosphatase MutT (NUDIX family)|nr:NUDIX domain-containing protein [Tepidisphaeraceae bacterium]